MACVQGTGVQGVGNPTSINVSFASPPTAGNLVAVGVAAFKTSIDAGDVTDNRVNTYDRETYQSTVDPRTGVFYCNNVLTGNPYTITDTTGSGAYPSMVIAEFDAVPDASPIDGTSITGSNTGTAVSTGNITTTDDAILFGVTTYDGGAEGITESYTLIWEEQNTSEMPINGQYRVTTGAAGFALTWTLGSSLPWSASAVAFKQPGVAGTLDQFAFRFVNDDDVEASATFAAAENANLTAAVGTKRVRAQLNHTGDPDAITPQWEYRHKPSGGAFGSWAKI